jgi:hypothetical protein
VIRRRWPLGAKRWDHHENRNDAERKDTRTAGTGTDHSVTFFFFCGHGESVRSDLGEDLLQNAGSVLLFASQIASRVAGLDSADGFRIGRQTPME